MEEPVSSTHEGSVLKSCNESPKELTEGLQQLTVCNRRARVHCFTEGAPDATIHIQLIDLGLQLYVWVGVGGAKFQNMYLAIQSRTVGDVGAMHVYCIYVSTNAAYGLMFASGCGYQCACGS